MPGITRYASHAPPQRGLRQNLNVTGLCILVAESGDTYLRLNVLPPEVVSRCTESLDMLWWFHHILEMSDNPIKPVSWIGASYKDFRAFPDPVQDTMGYALYRAQIGAKHESAKPLKGFGGAGVLEIVADHVGDTFRAVYTVKFATAIYVLHSFQKKSKAGVKTPTEVLELIRRRLKAAEADYKDRLGKGTRS